MKKHNLNNSELTMCAGGDDGDDGGEMPAQEMCIQEADDKRK